MADKQPLSYWHDALLAFGRMSSWIVGPILIALFVGKWLDRRFHTAPIIFVGATGLAFILSMIGLVREGKRYMQSVEEAAKKSPTPNDRTERDNNGSN